MVLRYPAPRVKSFVHAILDELAKDERVAAAYDLWNQMREETCRIYSESLPERLPLSRQKGFKSVRNMVIREAQRLAQDGRQPSLVQEESIGQSTNATVNEYNHAPARSVPTTTNVASAAGTVLRMFNAMGRIFEDNCKEDAIYRGLQMDRKRRRKLRELKRARGIKDDGAEQFRMG